MILVVWSFQTIKKFFSALYIGAEQFLVLDSESIMISNTNLNELFDRYFSMPEFFLSQVNDRPKKFKDGFTYAFVTLASELTHYPPIYWPLESYNWFLDLKILKKMIEQYGHLYDRICELKLPKKFHDEGMRVSYCTIPTSFILPDSLAIRHIILWTS